MNVRKIAIIGSGLSSLSFVNTLIKKLENSTQTIEILIFDKKESFGKGIAYGKDLESNILNTKAGYLTFDSSMPGDFYNWTLSNQSNLKKVYKFDFITLTRDSFLPRAIFGEYIIDKWKHIFSSYYQKLNIYPFYDFVENFIKVSEGKYFIKTEKGNSFYVDNIIIATGVSNRIFNKYRNDSRFFTTPYKTSDLISKVKINEDVLIVGSKLSAIDAVISLKESGHLGNIFMHSRSGSFPTIRGKQKQYQNKFLCSQFINEYFKTNISLSDVYQLYLNECNNYLKNNETLGMETIEDVYKKFPIDNLEDFIIDELAQADYDRPWQAILYDTNRSLIDMWDKLSLEDKNYFIDNYFYDLMKVRVSIPKENAIKIRDYLKSGDLFFSYGVFNIKEEQGNIIFQKGKNSECIIVKKVIFCTGSPENILESDSILLRNLIGSGMILVNKRGSININCNYNILNKFNLIDSNIFVLGELIRGKYLFIPAADLTCMHGEKCAEIFYQKFLKK
ncbi:FAD/NAD(P)-binding protein [Pasteurella testudinis]|uniref:FAD/NAD(P)-binding protein n=1 Tax=Pasteurella testudinis TaxID=761 RepID=UPI004059530C